MLSSFCLAKIRVPVNDMALLPIGDRFLCDSVGRGPTGCAATGRCRSETAARTRDVERRDGESNEEKPKKRKKRNRRETAPPTDSHNTHRSLPAFAFRCRQAPLDPFRCLFFLFDSHRVCTEFPRVFRRVRTPTLLLFCRVFTESSTGFLPSAVRL